MTLSRPLTRRFVAGAMVGLVGWAATPASAALSFSYYAGATDFSAAAGATIQVPVYVREIITTPSASLLVNDGGLYSGAFSAARIGVTGGAAGITGVTANTALTPANGGFSSGNNTVTNPSAASATLDINVGNSMTGAAATNLGGGEYRVLLGTLSILAPNSNGVTTFSLSKLNSGDTLTNLGNFLDANSTNPQYSAAAGSSFTVTVVPEPAVATLVTIGALTLIARHRSRLI